MIAPGQTSGVNVSIERPVRGEPGVEVPLAVWIATGPGPRPFVRPLRARSRSTGQPLPLSAVPLRYRNDEQSRQAIEDGWKPL